MTYQYRTRPPPSHRVQTHAYTQHSVYTSHSGAHQYNMMHWTEEREEGEEEEGTPLGHSRQLAMVLFPRS